MSAITAALDMMAEREPVVVLVFDDGTTYEAPLSDDNGNVVRHPLEALPPIPLPRLMLVAVACTGTAVVVDSGEEMGRSMNWMVMTADGYGMRTLVPGQPRLNYEGEPPPGDLPVAMARVLGREVTWAVDSPDMRSE